MFNLNDVNCNIYCQFYSWYTYPAIPVLQLKNTIYIIFMCLWPQGQDVYKYKS